MIGFEFLYAVMMGFRSAVPLRRGFGFSYIFRQAGKLAAEWLLVRYWSFFIVSWLTVRTVSPNSSGWTSCIARKACASVSND